MKTQRIHLLTLSGLFFSGILLYGLTMPRTVTFEDSGLFLQVCHFGGIAHPPGYPLFTILCSPLFAALPFDPVLIGNGISAVFGALTACVLYVILRRLEISYWFTVLGAVLLIIAKDFWSQAIIVEVYTLNTFLTLICLYLVIRFQQETEPIVLHLLTFCFCLGLSNHWPLMVLCVPGFGMMLAAKWPQLLQQLRSPRFIGGSLLCALLGLSPYFWLFQADPPFSYSGPVTSLAVFVTYFLRESFASVDQQAVADMGDSLSFIIWSGRQLIMQDGLWFGLFAVPGVFLTFRLWGVSIWSGLLLILIFHTVVLCLLLGFDYDYLYQAVMATYLLTAQIVFIIFIVSGIQLTWSRISDSRLKRGSIAVLIAFTGFSILVNAQFNNRSDDTLAHNYADQILSVLDEEAALIIVSDPQTFPIGYLHNVAGVRPDVSLYHGQNLFFKDKLIGASYEEFAESVNHMLNQRPVYSIGIPWLQDGEDLGILTRENNNQGRSWASNPTLNKFVEQLLFNYINQESRQPHNIYFLQQLLYDASLHLIEYSTINQLNEDELNLLLNLQTTFPGALATLAIALSNNQFNPPVEMLLVLAKPHIENIPVESDNLQEALFYYYLFLIEPDKQQAGNYLEKSAEIFPAADNPGFVEQSRQNGS